MSDLISRQDAILALLEKGQRSRRYKLGEIWELNFDEIREVLATVPSAEPVRHGKWIGYAGTIGNECSVCGKWIDVLQGTAEMNYCPNCSAQMEMPKETGE